MADLGQGVDLGAVSRTAPARSIAAIMRVEDLFDDEDFLFGDAQQVVVVGAALDDRAGGAIQVGRFIDDDRRIARPGDDRPFRLLHGRAGDGRPAGDAEQR